MNIRTPSALIGATLATSMLGACMHTAADTAVTTPMARAAVATSTAAGAPVAPGTMVINSPSEALALLAGVDQMEIALARLTLGKQVPAPVTEYANMMVAHHTPHLEQTRALLGAAGPMPGATPTMQKLMAAGQTAQAQLAGLQGDAYARAYIAQMVASHRHAIAMVDASMTVATTPALRDFLSMTRQALQLHHDRAVAIQAQLGA